MYIISQLRLVLSITFKIVKAFTVHVQVVIWLVFLTAIWQWRDNHREPGSVSWQISCVRVSGAHGAGDHSYPGRLHGQDYDSLPGKTLSQDSFIFSNIFDNWVKCKWRDRISWYILSIPYLYFLHHMQFIQIYLYTFDAYIWFWNIVFKMFFCMSERDAVSEYSQATWPDSQACRKMDFDKRC